ncbi:MAG: AtpZ/AtpI family protein [Patescibacteria group bacterium]|jgi:hypothetical protein
MPVVKNDNKNKANNEWLRQGMMMFAESTGWIAFPVIGALFLGQWLDERQGTGQLYFLSITALAFILSSVGIGMTGVKYMNRIEKDEAGKKNNKSNSLDKTTQEKKQENEPRNDK